MDDGPEGPVPDGGGAEQEPLARALRGACGAPCADLLRGMRDAATAALASARGTGETLAAASAQAQLAAALGADDDLAGALRHRDGAATLLARAPGGDRARRREALLWIGLVDLSALGDVRSARDRFARAAVLATAGEPPEVTLAALAIRALASTVAGDLAGAVETSRAALELARASGEPTLLAVALAAQVRQLAIRRDGAALAACEELLALRDAPADEQAAIAAWAVAPALLDAGEAGRARELIAPATEPARLARLLPQARSELLEVRVRAAVALGDGDDAHRQLEALEQLPFSRTQHGAASAGCAAAVVALADDRPLNAEARATAAAEAARRAPSRTLELRATLLAGHAQAALGAPEVAAERFVEAEDIAGALGGRACGSRGAGERSRSADDAPPPAGAFGLTPRQLEIARLVAAGATNREVAAALGISEHTVNTHLRVAFSRLGVTRRTALASALQQRTTA